MIRSAFLELLKEKDLQKITVTDIVKKTGLNRSTFYCHYPDIRGIIEEIENELIDNLLNILAEFKYTDFFSNPAPSLLKVSRLLEKDVEFYRALILANGADRFLEKLKKIFAQYMLEHSDIPQEYKKSKSLSLRICYFSGGMVNMYQQWFKGELDCSLNDISIEVSQLITLASNQLFTDKGQ
ncbi:MAG: TetR/AcrR family transcriptional regulator [Erysipelotrichaceae bacterium]